MLLIAIIVFLSVLNVILLVLWLTKKPTEKEKDEYTVDCAGTGGIPWCLKMECAAFQTTTCVKKNTDFECTCSDE